MSSLMDSVMNWITPELTSSLASRFGIPADTVNSSLQTSSAVMLTTMAGKAHDTNFLSSIFGMLTGSGTAAAAAATAGNGAAGGPTELGSNFLRTLFGSHQQEAENKVAQNAHIPQEAGSAVMASAAPLVIGALSNKINGGGLSMAALGSALTTELPSLRSYLPAGFAIPGFIGFGGIGTSGAGASSSAANTAQGAAAVDETKSSAGWLWPVLLLGALLIAGLIWYFNQAPAPPVTAVADTASQATNAVAGAAGKVGDAAQNAVGALGAFFKHKLPDGTELSIPEGGVENKLISFIEDKSKPVDKDTWFDFDRLLFATGSAHLESSSNEQLRNVAAIMKAYPNVHLRIGGYTDNTGAAAANLKLSQERASTVMTQLVSLGVEPSRLEAKGYGEEHPVADNATEAGRAQNRRISVRVTQK